MQSVRAYMFAVLAKGDAPDWIEVVPAGTINTRDARGPYLNSDPQAVIDATEALDMNAGLPVDYDHATDLAAPEGRPAPAAGWMQEFQVRDGAIWARVEWTAAGAQAIAAGEWRYISPVVEVSKDKQRRVLRILRAALTNNPNLYLAAIAARDKGDKMDQDEFRARMAALCGLEADASHEQIVAEMNKKFAAKAAHDTADGDGDRGSDNDGDEANAATAALKALTVELNALKVERSRERAAVKVDQAIAGGKLFAAQREWAIAYCARDEKDFDTFLAGQAAMKLGEDKRFAGSAAASNAGAIEISAAEREIAANFGLSVEEYAKSKNAKVGARVIGASRAGE
jgi:phage I-like protein